MKQFIYLVSLLLLSCPIALNGQLNTPSKPKRKQLKSLDPPAKRSKGVKVDPVIEGLLGKKPATRLAKAKQVKVFEVEPFKAEDIQATHTLEGFTVLQTAILDKKQQTEIKKLLTSKATYFLTEDTKQCLFLPKMGLQFLHKSDTIRVLISFKCDLIRFYYKNKTTVLDSDDGHDRLIKFFKNAFPQNGGLALKSMTLEVSKQPIFYTTQFGDSWFVLARKIANTYDKTITINHLYDWNDVPKKKRNHLPVGQKVIIGYQERE